MGIHEEDQGFWDSIYPASEMREANTDFTPAFCLSLQPRQVCRLTSCQRRALAQVRAHATASHEERSKPPSLSRRKQSLSCEDAEKRVLTRFEEMGFSDKELQADSSFLAASRGQRMNGLLQAVLSWIQDLAPVIIHVNIDTVGRFLESDEYYRTSLLSHAAA